MKGADTMARKIMSGRRVNFDDDMVVIYRNGKLEYKGLQDYNPYRDEDWEWDDKKKHYTMRHGKDEYIMVCLDI